MQSGEAPVGERLQKLLARAGLGSRRSAEALIASGRVTVNGVVALVGQRADPERDAVALDGVPVPLRQELVYYLLNKPPGVVCSARGSPGCPSVLDLVPRHPRVFSVGRLDVASEGLLVLTNDGELAYKLAHPRFGVAKEYLVEVEGRFSDRAVGRLRRGVQLDDGPTAPAKVKVVGPSAARIVVHEGRNRLVRRMCEAVGLPVRRLARTRIGPLTSAELEPGRWRRLSVLEVRALWQAAGAQVGEPRANCRAKAKDKGKQEGLAPLCVS
ncbi:MAG: pseudouridine synthase [Acidimicrobiales bacterium]